MIGFYPLAFFNVIKYCINNPSFGIPIVEKKLTVGLVGVPIKHSALLMIPPLTFVQLLYFISLLLFVVKMDQVDVCRFVFTWQMVVKRGG